MSLTICYYPRCGISLRRLESESRWACYRRRCGIGFTDREYALYYLEKIVISMRNFGMRTNTFSGLINSKELSNPRNWSNGTIPVEGDIVQFGDDNV